MTAEALLERKTNFCFCSTEHDPKEFHTHRHSGRDWEVEEASAIVAKCGDAMHPACLYKFLTDHTFALQRLNCPFCRSTEWLHSDSFPQEVRREINRRLSGFAESLTPRVTAFLEDVGDTYANNMGITNETARVEACRNQVVDVARMAAIEAVVTPFMINRAQLLLWVIVHGIALRLFTSDDTDGAAFFLKAFKFVAWSAIYHLLFKSCHFPNRSNQEIIGLSSLIFFVGMLYELYSSKRFSLSTRVFNHLLGMAFVAQLELGLDSYYGV